jgi:ribosomal protein S18 acetylase RimI-like enzyme
VAGFASMRFESWNKRSILRHLYVAPDHRRRGVGRALVEAISSLSDSVGSRCVWVETQNINYPAIQFYLRLGFQLCGLDTSLYDLSSKPTQEIGLFFARFANMPSPNHPMQLTGSPCS